MSLWAAHSRDDRNALPRLSAQLAGYESHKYVDAGVDEYYVQQIGPDMDGFFDAWERDVLPEFQESPYA